MLAAGESNKSFSEKKLSTALVRIVHLSHAVDRVKWDIYTDFVGQIRNSVCTIISQSRVKKR